MDNQHRQIKGYRELSQVEIDLMNAIKGFGPDIQALLTQVNAHVASQRRGVIDLERKANASKTVDAALVFKKTADKERDRLNAAQPERWAALACTHFQEGLMALTRAVAQPTFF